MGAEVSFPTIGGVRYCEVTGDGTVRGLGTFDLTAAGGDCALVGGDSGVC